jgi:tryptophan halogenase
MSDISKNIVIAGGGATGWLSALILKNNFPEHNISIIKSDQVGIIGVGESLTSEFTQNLIDLDIDVVDFIKSTSASVKVGIKYSGWRNDEKDYHNVFITQDYFDINKEIDNKIENEIPLRIFPSIIDNQNLDNYSIGTEILNKNLVPFESEIMDSTKFKEVKSLTKYAFNVDAKKLAEFLEKEGIKRKIVVHEGFINTIKQDTDGYITNIILDNGKDIPSDFVFDCTGLSRKIIGEHFKSTWIDLSKSLPCKKAIAFFLENESNTINPYVTASAMDYGWMWHTPLQHRVGCGYVFDPKYINEDEAKKEVEKKLGYEIKIQRVLDFNAGYYSKTWIKNCISLGMSAGFQEPLEALTIFQGSVALKFVIRDFERMLLCNEKYIEEYNTFVAGAMDKTAGFIYLHYITDKTNSDFWKDFTKNNIMPNHLKEQINNINKKILTYKVSGSYAVSPYNYYSIMYPKGLINTKIIKDFCDTLDTNKLVEKNNEYFNEKRERLDKLTTHYDFLKNIGVLSD